MDNSYDKDEISRVIDFISSDETFVINKINQMKNIANQYFIDIVRNKDELNDTYSLKSQDSINGIEYENINKNLFNKMSKNDKSININKRLVNKSNNRTLLDIDLLINFSSLNLKVNEEWLKYDKDKFAKIIIESKYLENDESISIIEFKRNINFYYDQYLKLSDILKKELNQEYDIDIKCINENYISLILSNFMPYSPNQNKEILEIFKNLVEKNLKYKDTRYIQNETNYYNTRIYNIFLDIFIIINFFKTLHKLIIALFTLRKEKSCQDEINSIIFIINGKDSKIYEKIFTRIRNILNMYSKHLEINICIYHLPYNNQFIEKITAKSINSHDSLNKKEENNQSGEFTKLFEGMKQILNDNNSNLINKVVSSIELSNQKILEEIKESNKKILAEIKESNKNILEGINENNKIFYKSQNDIKSLLEKFIEKDEERSKRDEERSKRDEERYKRDEERYKRDEERYKRDENFFKRMENSNMLLTFLIFLLIIIIILKN